MCLMFTNLAKWIRHVVLTRHQQEMLYLDYVGNLNQRVIGALIYRFYMNNNGRSSGVALAAT